MQQYEQRRDIDPVRGCGSIERVRTAAACIQSKPCEHRRCHWMIRLHARDGVCRGDSDACEQCAPHAACLRGCDGCAKAARLQDFVERTWVERSDDLEDVSVFERGGELEDVGEWFLTLRDSRARVKRNGGCRDLCGDQCGLGARGGDDRGKAATVSRGGANRASA